ncbi:hypothetical protein [Plasticicumulans sp.]|uniref:hypothetical protein n=1 Tax=Plasticicumulans sp. TaxID=2307179 RepID=UPI0032202BBE
MDQLVIAALDELCAARAAMKRIHDLARAGSCSADEARCHAGLAALRLEQAQVALEAAWQATKAAGAADER